MNHIIAFLSVAQPTLLAVCRQIWLNKYNVRVQTIASDGLYENVTHNMSDDRRQTYIRTKNNIFLNIWNAWRMQAECYNR